MGNFEDAAPILRKKTIDELRSQSVGKLLQIIDELDAMRLPVGEIETILKVCGLDAANALSIGAEIRGREENDHFHTGSPIHP